jgi:glycosyltransferase involved in cell wall biosynthesis
MILQQDTSFNTAEQNVKPLISLLIVTYNHEEYILEALKGAAAQTYSPLEIIVSDDASTDRTAEIIKDFVRKYQGPHTWRININKTNLGILDNCMLVADLAKGEMFVSSDGDDISLPYRVEACFNYFQRHPDHAYFICKAEWMDEHGNPIPADFGHPESRSDVIWNIRHHMPGAWGTCSCHHRKLYELFGPIKTPNLRLVDNVLAFRAVLLGGCVNFLNEIQVRYRQHSGGVVSAKSSTLRKSLRENYIVRAHDLIRVFQQMLLDLEVAQRRGMIQSHMYMDAIQVIHEEMYAMQSIANALSGPIQFRVWKLLVYISRGVISIIRNASCIKRGFCFRND